MPKKKKMKKIPYDSRQKRFTTYPNFQEFVNAKKVICKCGQIISLEVNYQVFGQLLRFMKNMDNNMHR